MQININNILRVLIILAPLVCSPGCLAWTFIFILEAFGEVNLMILSHFFFITFFLLKPKLRDVFLSTLANSALI
jgi:hypothetical protein